MEIMKISTHKIRTVIAANGKQKPMWHSASTQCDMET